MPYYMAMTQKKGPPPGKLPKEEPKKIFHEKKPPKKS